MDSSNIFKKLSAALTSLLFLSFVNTSVAGDNMEFVVVNGIISLDKSNTDFNNGATSQLPWDIEYMKDNPNIKVISGKLVESIYYGSSIEVFLSAGNIKSANYRIPIILEFWGNYTIKENVEEGLSLFIIRNWNGIKYKRGQTKLIETNEGDLFLVEKEFINKHNLTNDLITIDISNQQRNPHVCPSMLKLEEKGLIISELKANYFEVLDETKGCYTQGVPLKKLIGKNYQ